MNISYLSSKDWQVFIERYPSAYYYLLRCSLEGEKVSLKRELETKTYTCPGRKAWIINRLKELEAN